VGLETLRGVKTIIDWYFRRMLGWPISNSMDAVYCIFCLEEALRRQGKPEIFNSDRGLRFTRQAFPDVLKREVACAA